MPEDDYLWDRSGTPDRDIEQWERALGQFARVGDPPELRLPAAVVRRRWPYWLAAAAACLLVAAGVGVRTAWQPGAEWRVSAAAGSPVIDGMFIRSGGHLGVGGLLSTDSASRAKVHMGLMGTIEVEPNSRVKLVSTGDGRHRISLESGTIAARMWAPPFTLAVDTASATAVDLGCAFVVHVDESGSGFLRVTSGWVQFQLGDRKVIVPAGAMALTRPGVGPGTPLFEDASGAMRAALENFDFGGGGTAALAVVLAEARPRDVVTLLSLMQRLGPVERGLVYDKASAFVAPPSGYTREDAVDGTNPAGADEWWLKLGLGDAKNWLVNWRDVLGR